MSLNINSIQNYDNTLFESKRNNVTYNNYSNFIIFNFNEATEIYQKFCNAISNFTNLDIEHPKLKHINKNNYSHLLFNVIIIDLKCHISPLTLFVDHDQPVIDLTHITNCNLMNLNVATNQLSYKNVKYFRHIVKANTNINNYLYKNFIHSFTNQDKTIPMITENTKIHHNNKVEIITDKYDEYISENMKLHNHVIIFDFFQDNDDYVSTIKSIIFISDYMNKELTLYNNKTIIYKECLYSYEHIFTIDIKQITNMKILNNNTIIIFNLNELISINDNKIYIKHELNENIMTIHNGEIMKLMNHQIRIHGLYKWINNNINTTFSLC